MLRLLCLWTLLTIQAAAQCEPSRDVAAALAHAKLTAAEPRRPFDARLGAYRALADRYPDDVFVNRTYIAALTGYVKWPLQEELLFPRYPATSPYFHALSIAQRDRKQAIAILESLDGPWPQLALAGL